MKLDDAKQLKVGDRVSKIPRATPYSTHTWEGTIAHEPHFSKLYVDGSLVFQLAVDVRRHQANAQRKGQDLKGSAGYYVDVTIRGNTGKQSIQLVQLETQKQEAA